MAEMRFVTEVAARRGEVLTHTPVGESSASTAEVARTEASDVSAAAEAADVCAATEAADASATEPAAHMSATTEPPAVSTPTTVSTPASPAARERVSGQSPGESGSRRQNDHGLA